MNCAHETILKGREQFSKPMFGRLWLIITRLIDVIIYILYVHMELYSPIYQGHPLIYQPERFRVTSVTEVTIVLDRGVKSDSLSVKPAMPVVGRCWLGNMSVIFSHHV